MTYLGYKTLWRVLGGDLKERDQTFIGAASH